MVALPPKKKPYLGLIIQIMKSLMERNAMDSNEIEYEKLITGAISLIASIIKKSDVISPSDAISLKSISPELFVLLRSISFDELYEILDRNKDNAIHGDRIKELLNIQYQQRLIELLSVVNECDM